MEKDRLKWDDRYAGEGYFIGPHPSPFLAERIAFMEALLPGRRALDIACGEGRNSIFLARRGFAVTGIDISAEGLAKAGRWAAAEGLEIDFVQADLEGYEFTERYDLILNFNFLLRELIPRMVAALTPGGVIVFDTILDSPAMEGHHSKAFLLQPGELAALFSPFPGTILHYEERAEGPISTARLIFQKS
ncbi:MAG: class I SAM-dependent methyltransferase [Geobacteraceae bacterium]|nr:class I SAM-dependent methyltransferase [Geobacteraceae bacterium]